MGDDISNASGKTNRNGKDISISGERENHLSDRGSRDDVNGKRQLQSAFTGVKLSSKFYGTPKFKSKFELRSGAYQPESIRHRTSSHTFIK